MTFMKLFVLLYTLAQQQTLYSKTNDGEFHKVIVTHSIYGHQSPAIIYLPKEALGYNAPRLPLIISFHGRSGAGHDITKVFREGVLRQIKEGKKIEAYNRIDHKLYKFIVMTPLSENWSFAADGLNCILNDVLKRFPIDSTRMYVTGYSAGGWSSMMAITDSAVAPRIAAAVPMSPSAIDEQHVKQFKVTAENNVHAWYFAGTGETLFLQNAEAYIDSTKHYKPGLTRFTRHAMGHGGFYKFYTPDYREGDMNIYEWMIMFRKHY
ncbi:hypothetical protein [Chitinophaga vietnamensis]|uniref:hypothetical protein n=1 Tax=Chitinophaga vietnamensis TaxID=2593957 RepID=UPI00117740F5|nr:hypothetical protein [Chitinophaga vietnamensis]